MELKKEHIGIMRHTDLNQVYCGSEPELEELCVAGIMKCLGKKSFFPEPYYSLTTKGKEELFQFEVNEAHNKKPTL